MLDRTFRELVLSVTPPMNEEVMNGYVCHEVKDLEKRVDEILRKAYDGLFEGRLRYLGFTPCTPQEEFDFSTRPKNTRRAFELAQSSFYLIRIRMEYGGHPLPDVFMYLPFVDPGGLIHIGGPLYHLIPVLSDKVISTEQHHIFVRLYQFKMNFYEKIHTIVVNGAIDRPSVAWGNIYKQKTSTKKSVNTKTISCLVNYLLARDGFSGMFKRFCGFAPIAGTKETITEDKYPSDQWVIVKTGYDRAKPADYPKMSYVPTKIMLAIPKANWNAYTRALVAGFYYVVDYFPDKCEVDNLDNLVTWKRILGLILLNNELTPGRMISMIEEHFESSDTYMDEISIQKLSERGFQISTFTDLLGLIACRYHEFRSDTGDGEVIYGRYLNTLQEVLHPITTAIFTNKYQLMKEGVKGPPTFNVVKDRFIRRFKPGWIFKLTSNKSQVTEVVSYSGDHKYYKITSRLTQQKSTPDTKNRKGRKVMNDSHHITTAQMMVGSVLFLSKTNPIPLSHVNPYVCIDKESGTILENPKFKDVLAVVDGKLNQKS